MPKGFKGFQKGNKIGLGRVAWNKGGLPDDLRLALVERNKERIGEKHYMWKGENVSYGSLHDWVYRHKGNPIKCEFCNSVEKLHWANKSQEYKRELADWISLCASCHAKYDANWVKRERQSDGTFR